MNKLRALRGDWLAAAAMVVVVVMLLFMLGLCVVVSRAGTKMPLQYLRGRLASITNKVGAIDREGQYDLRAKLEPAELDDAS